MDSLGVLNKISLLNRFYDGLQKKKNNNRSLRISLNLQTV